MGDFYTAAAAAVLTAAGYGAVSIINKSMLDIITSAGFCRKNYLGKEIPAGAGVIFSLGALAVSPLFLFALSGRLIEKSAIFLLTLIVYTLLGLMDDCWGEQKSRGFKGHIKSLIEGRPTTGAVKALGGGLAALYIAVLIYAESGSLIMIPLDALALALSVNTFNLLDLRPGRAGKVYLASAAVLIILFSSSPPVVFLALTAGSLAAYLPADLKGRAMMGDAGANALGAVMGLSVVWLFSVETKAVYLLALAAVNIISEKYSLTGIIASNRMLNYIDMLGRNRK
ncbi:MAG: hypothetical protein M1130_04745 [Actinobacteria bacterium]|nr:hypothetical protein [Actinomycetota bacterium]